jgi:arylsulfatase A
MKLGSIFFIKLIMLFTGCCTCVSKILGQNTKPNIIYFLADDLGYGDVSALNENSKLITVNIDRLANEGIKFTDAHSNSAVCTPTRYGILTGRYAWRTSLQSGVLWSYDTPLIAPARLTVASLLKQNGYNTACIGKWHLGLDWQKNNTGDYDFSKEVENGPNTNGFDYSFIIAASLDIPPYVYIENKKVTATSFDTIAETKGKGFWRKGVIGNDFVHEEVLEKVTDKAVGYIKEQSLTGKPFFLYLAFPSPHTPILPSKKYLGKSGTNAYGDYVLMLDDMIGKILSEVKDAGIDNNTLIIFTSDNGCSPAADFEELAKFGHHPSYVFRGEKSDIFDGGHRIPFIAKWPGKINKGAIGNITVCLTDFIATCAAIVKTQLPANAGEDSYNMLPLLVQDNNSSYLRTSTVHHSIEGHFAIREGKWKLIFSPGSGGWSYPTPADTKLVKLPPLQLYDLETDMEEKKMLQIIILR